MADTPNDPASPVPPYEDALTAPIVYFDAVSAQGIMNGAIQIELAARTLAPGSRDVIVKFMTTARVRCSPAAAIQLRAAIDGALKMLNQSQEAPAAVSILN